MLVRFNVFFAFMLFYRHWCVAQTEINKIHIVQCVLINNLGYVSATSKHAVLCCNNQIHMFCSALF